MELNENLKEACGDYIAEQLITEQDINGMEVCQRYLEGTATSKETRALIQFFNINEIYS